MMNAIKQRSVLRLIASRVILSGLVLCLGGARAFGGDVAPAPVPAPAPASVTSMVTINVDNGPITQVLNAFSRQTGRSIVICPEVTGNITLRVNERPWQEALEVMLGPYGYAHYLIGDTIVICGADKLPKKMGASSAPASTNAAAPLYSSAKPEELPELKVFTLKYLNAADVEKLVKNLLPKVNFGKLLATSQSWTEQVAQSGGQSTSSESLGRLNRFGEKDEVSRGKTLVVVDTPAVIKQVEEILAKLDVMPVQILIEAKFVEVSANLLRDIGVEWGSGADGSGTPIGTSYKGSLYAAGASQVSGGVKPNNFTPQSSSMSSTAPFNAGLSLAFQKLTDLQFQVLLHLMEEDSSYNMLSSPRVMTMDNQDAIILVGTKFPIIQTQENNSAGTQTSTTSLEKYEDIGIKLKVLPQVCEDNFINLIVHPSVRELLGYQSGNSGSSAANAAAAGVSVSASGASYPIIAAREAETQVMVKSGQTIVIGGMMRDKSQKTQIKVPFLGSIPILGALFRRDTTNTEKIELLIFVTATIRSPGEGLAFKVPEVKSLIKLEANKTEKK